MLLDQPPTPAELSRLPRTALRGRTLHQVFRASRPSPWWFGHLPARPEDAAAAGRFDLPEPLGACYFAGTPIAAMLEAFQDLGPAVLPDVELRLRRRAEVIAPPTAPAAADLSATRARAFGITAALWAGDDRARTQEWALALVRAGWRALHHGIQHDPAGRLRAVTLFDQAGEHPPFGDAEGWAPTVHTLHDDASLIAALGRYGIRVLRSDVQLPTVSLEDSGLLE